VISPDRLEPYAAHLRLVPLDCTLARPETLVAGLLNEIGRRCVDAGASLIGHVKCHVMAEPNGAFYVNLTSLRSGAHWGGEPPPSATALEVDLAVLVYGLEAACVHHATTEALRSVAEPAGVLWAMRAGVSPGGSPHSPA